MFYKAGAEGTGSRECVCGVISWLHDKVNELVNVYCKPLQATKELGQGLGYI